MSTGLSRLNIIFFILFYINFHMKNVFFAIVFSLHDTYINGRTLQGAQAYSFVRKILRTILKLRNKCCHPVPQDSRMNLKVKNMVCNQKLLFY